MNRFPPIPRLSIVIPIGSDIAAFENSLVSVLEHRPIGSEILVAHDGSYDDPFDLCDEVKFVTASSGRPVELISAGIDVSRGRFVHLLGAGVAATEGWADAALEQFERHDAGVVTPVIRHRTSQTIVAAGWYDGPSGLCQPNAFGETELSRYAATRCVAPFIQASFWRRDVLRSLAAAFWSRATCDQASYGYGHMLQQAGWRNVVAAECQISCEQPSLPWYSSSFARGRSLAAIRGNLRATGFVGGMIRSAKSLFSHLMKPAHWGESIGYSFGALSSEAFAAHMHHENVVRCEPHTLPLPQSGQNSARKVA